MTDAPEFRTHGVRAEAGLVEARAAVQAQLARTDTKASFLVAFDGAVLAGCGAVAGRVPGPQTAAVAAGVAALLLVAAAAVVLSVIRPRLRPAAPGSVPHLATLTARQARTHLGQDHRAEELVVLARMAVTKFRGLQRAVDLTRAAGAALILAAALTLWSAR
ncbi:MULTISPECIES: Pycsar system effector family protein [unclassified Streptomyces]|uniref:Pycsar system effector family protein n=1 Tax=unclassified Streptomyces TaxID=2593676 RepID=UPI000CD4E02F|nr:MULTISPECIES: Pycsar system effector family protein [unclassified Streptomyces]